MRRPLLAVLAAVACMLLVVIVLEYRGVGRQAFPVGSQRAPAQALPGSARSGGAARIEGTAGIAGVSGPEGTPPPMLHLDGWAATILERPLFNPSRHPGQIAASGLKPPRLAGIIVGPDGARAIFAADGDARAIVAGIGAHAGPYLIRNIGPGGVAVEGPNGSEILHPSYDATAQGAPGVAGAASPPSILDLLRGRIQNSDTAKPPTPPK